MRAMSNLKAEVHGVDRPAWAADDAKVRRRHRYFNPGLSRTLSAGFSWFQLLSALKLTDDELVSSFAMNGLNVSRPYDALAAAIAAVPVVAFKPKDGVRIETDPKATAAASSMGMDDEAIIEDLLSKLQAVRAGFKAGQAAGARRALYRSCVFCVPPSSASLEVGVWRGCSRVVVVSGEGFGFRFRLKVQVRFRLRFQVSFLVEEHGST